MDTPTPSQPAGGQPAGQQNGLLALFLEDQRLLGGGGSAFGQPDGAASTSGSQNAPPASSSSSTAAPAVGWGGQPINDSSGYKVPWFGRRRGAAGHRQRQCRAPGGAEGQNSAASRGDEGGGNRSTTSSSAAFGGGAAGGGGAGPGNGNSNNPQQQQQQGAPAEQPLSVEEIVQVLKQTRRCDPVPARVYASLQPLDSRAVALLLKDISKAGLDSRSIELFDWLRRLPERHLLRPLCDVFTYTAMISLCIYQQNVERAMELLDEMRQRGVERNVHTYTALMNVCIKCGKLTSALEIFATMKSEGCLPNVVTYNTLIDVHGKLGQWDRAVGVLSMMRAEGVTPALRTFNTLIIACNMCNKPREALAVYQELRDSGFEANSTTYNALISAYGKLGQLDRVLEVYKDMVWRGLDRSVITYSSLISACEKAGRWETALQLFDEMQRDGCTPNTVTYNSLITACGQGAQWEKARTVYEQMQGNGCQPDVVTYTALISAYERGGQWLLALKAFEEMVARGCWPDAIVYNAIIDALWQTGVIWAQAKARELFAMAVKQGHFRNERVSADGQRAELNLHALTAGVAMLSLQSYLLDMQSKVKASGDSSLPAQVAIVTDAGSASKEQGNFIIKDAASTSMSFWGSPFRVVQDRTYLGLLEATGQQVAQWVRSSSFQAMMSSLFPPLPDPSTLQQPRAVQQLELGAQKDCQSAFDAVRRFEASHNLALQHMGVSFLQQRSALVGSILQKGGELRLPDEVVHDAVLLLDRAGSTGVQVGQDVLSVVSAAVLLIAVQQTSGGSEEAAKLSAGPISDAFGVEAQSVLDMAWQLRQVLQNDTVAISAMRCLKVYMERMGCGQLKREWLYLVAGLPMMLAVEAQFDTSLLNCRPSVVAAALLYAERRQRGAVPFWPSMLAKMTGYEDLTTPELACAVKSAQKLCRKAHYTQLYRTQCANITAQLLGLPTPQQQQQQQQQQQAVAGSSMQQGAPSAAVVLGVQGLEQQQQAAAALRAVGMQADTVVAAPQLSRLPSLSIATSGLSLQPSLSGPLSARALSASSSTSSGAVGAGGVMGSVGSACGIPGSAAASGMLRPGSVLGGSGGVTGLPVSAAQQSQQATNMDLALLAQLQMQQQQQQQHQQHQQQQQQQAGALLTYSTAGLLGGNNVQLAASNGMQLATGGGGGGFTTNLGHSLHTTNVYPGGVTHNMGAAAGGGGFAGPAISPFSLGLQVPTMQQQQQQLQDQHDVAGLEGLALTLSALGLHGASDGQISAAALEAALRQQH